MILEALSNAFGPSGCENEVRQIVVDAIDGSALPRLGTAVSTRGLEFDCNT